MTKVFPAFDVEKAISYQVVNDMLHFQYTRSTGVIISLCHLVYVYGMEMSTDNQ